MNLDTSVLGSFIYFVNYILRNVVCCKTVGQIHDGRSITQWLDQNKFERIFDLTTSQLLQSDLTFSANHVDCVVAYNPFNDMSVVDVSRVLNCMRDAKVCLILAIHTAEHKEFTPKLILSVKKWRKILSQIGNVVEINHNANHSLFLVIHGNRTYW